MSYSALPNRRLFILAKVGGALLFLAVFITLSAAQYYVSNVSNGFEPVWWNMVGLAVPEWILWAVLVPLVHRLSKRFPITKERRIARIVLHLILSVIVAAFHVVATTALTIGVGLWDQSFVTVLGVFAGVRLHYDVVIYWAIAGASWAYTYYEENRLREVQAARYEAQTAQLAAQLSEARLHALTMQLQPHFLFNTLHAISTLVHSAPDRAEQMLALLSDLLRQTLEADEAPEIPLCEELDLLKQYLAIEQVRFQDRLTIIYQVDEAVRDAQVPPFILQPLVENAIRHGIMQRPGPGHITISAQQEVGRLVLTIRDDGVGLAPRARTKGQGIGLRNTEARLQQLYGEAYQLDVNAQDEGGVKAQIILPYQETDRGVITRVAHIA